MRVKYFFQYLTKFLEMRLVAEVVVEGLEANFYFRFSFLGDEDGCVVSEEVNRDCRMSGEIACVDAEEQRRQKRPLQTTRGDVIGGMVSTSLARNLFLLLSTSSMKSASNGSGLLEEFSSDLTKTFALVSTS
ncbi:hypothetical protein TNIN_27401 [Trichonephila inaurata madagascariensis]|uniref:Uncharacterized protein n=1 Tax=Trichonephila inaurata madagascariensis TaxID=2747483 RepID=A0A8X6X5I5_9ARAC|nr:hypothetical protein TNIN_27401 [Trichonephila inaurata madagascariensis]